MKNFNQIGEAGKTLGQHYVEAMDAQLEVTNQQTTEVTETPEAAAAEKPKKLKWFEEEGAFPYQEGDIVQIISGKDLILRKAVVVKPSAKKNAVKAQLIHPVSGQPQKTQCSFDFERLLLIESNGKQVNEPLVAEDKKEKVETKTEQAAV